MTASHECVESLVSLGLPEIEAEAYVFLLQHSPATGYRVAKAIGRSFGTTYKALASLKERGAILVDQGPSRLSRAVSLEEFLDQLETGFRARRQRAAAAVAKLPRSSADTRIYELTSAQQVYERCRRMLSEARERVLLELFPEPLRALRDAVEATAARGVEVAARVYEPVDIPGVRVVVSPFGERTLEQFRSEWLAVYVDGREYLLGNLLRGGEGVHQVIWSANPVLAWALYDYVNSDLHHYAFRDLLYAAGSIEEAKEAYRRVAEAFPVGADLGFQDWLDSVADGSPTEEEPQK